MSKSQDYALPNWYLKAYRALVVAVFALIALGGAVRIMKAGLACPDWPLCFGDVIPDFHPQVYFEFIHRAVAGSVALVTVALQVVLFRSRAPRAVKVLGGLSLVLLLTQIVFGGLTVLLLLKAGVVASHLMLGTSFFISLLWIYLSLKNPQPEAAVGPTWLARWCLLICALVYAQILLGGLVASNFASLVCIDWPTCHGEWFPTFSGIIGLHIIHRLGAYFVALMAAMNWWVMSRNSHSTRLRGLARGLFFGVCCQVGLGIANVLLLTPPLIAVLHLATGVFMLSLTFRQLHMVRELWSPQPSSRPRVSAESPAAVQGELA
jgi:cytochrome c oxidase assembly protein subunit 15